MKLSAESQMVKGHMDLLILAVIYHLGTAHGYRIRQVLTDRSDRTVQPSFGQLYPNLAALEKYGWITGQTETVCDRRERRIYSLTTAGKTELKRRIHAWNSFSDGISRVLYDIHL